ncbi:FAD/NAD(P)-binding domain-containing protein, partial [Russula earlei]
MLKIILSALIAASLSRAFQFQLPLDILDRFRLTKPEHPPPPPVVISSSRRPPRIAIIGAGAGGSSAAFWISKAKERYNLDVTVDVYERSDYIGGRSTTAHPYNDTAYEPVELGASIFVGVNKNLQRAVKEFNFSLYGFDDEDGDLGIWDGEQVLYTAKGSGTLASLLSKLKFLWRYGYRSPTKTQELIRAMLDKYVTLYDPDTPKWASIEALNDALNWTEFITQTGAEYFQSRGISEQYATEIIEAGTRVNYAQNIDRIHALEAMCSLAADGGVSVRGGNWQIFEQFVKRSGAQVFPKHRGDWHKTALRPRLDCFTEKERRNYEAVVIAAPYHTSHITLPADLSTLIPPQPYVHLHVTLLTTAAATPNPVYFGYKPGSRPPTTVLTTFNGAREGGNASEFLSLTYHGKTKGKTDEWVVKIFSMERISDEWLSSVFQNQVGWVLRKEWNSYPVLPPTTS